MKPIPAILSWWQRVSGGVTFLIPGATIVPLMEELVQLSSHRLVVACHELGAAYMADGFARARSGSGLCLAIGGPGAANMLPAAVVARLDRSAVLFVSGVGPTRLAGKNPFQDTGETGGADQALYAAALSCTVRLARTDDWPATRDRVSAQLNKGLPAHLALPLDIQADLLATPGIVGDAGTSGLERPGVDAALTGMVADVAERLAGARCPLLWVGAGLLNEAGCRSLRYLLERYPLPMVTTYGAKGVLAETEPWVYGNLGYGGRAAAYDYVAEGAVDVVLILGACLGQRDLLDWHPVLAKPGCRWLRVDTVPAHGRLALAYEVDHLIDDLPGYVLALAERCARMPAREGMIRQAPGPRHRRAPAASTGIAGGTSESRLRLAEIVPVINELLPPETTLVVDSGLHRMMAGQGWQCRSDLSFYSAASSAPMGWAVAAAIGVQLARPQSLVAVLTGDGCMRMHGVELATAARYRLPVIYLVANNRGYGSICHRVAPDAADCVGRLPLVDWVRFAAALGVTGRRVRRMAELPNAIAVATACRTRPFLIELMIDPQEVHPGYVPFSHARAQPCRIPIPS